MTCLANTMSKILVTFYFLLTTILAIYSYGYLDFNLTLSSHPIFLAFLAPLQQLVYYDRPQSAYVYAVIFASLMTLYLLLLRRKSRPATFPWLIFLLLMFILWLSYPLLSYDVFNYMFHGKILWFYQSNPHTVAPLFFEGDLWLRFMRWVHTPSAYGPVFTLVESPAYLLGLGKFVPVLYLMKATMIAFYVWCVYLVGVIMRKLNQDNSTIVLSQLMLAFNPFLWLELVLNAHNDAVMIAFLLFALSSSLNHQKVLSMVSLVLSIGVKYVTALSAPFLLIKNNRLKVILITLSLLAPVLLSPGRFQPWYLTWSLIPAILINHSWARVWIITTSLAGLIYYIPYIYTGFWNLSDVLRLSLIYGPTTITVIYFAYLKKHI